MPLRADQVLLFGILLQLYCIIARLLCRELCILPCSKCCVWLRLKPNKKEGLAPFSPCNSAWWGGMNLECLVEITQNTSSSDCPASCLTGSLAVMHWLRNQRKPRCCTSCWISQVLMARQGNRMWGKLFFSLFFSPVTCNIDFVVLVFSRYESKCSIVSNI